jgi:Tol biopolymer transport system component
LARWSPDGSEILFAGAHERFNGAMLFVVHADGTGLRKIPLQVDGSLSAAFTPGWSPDGTRIIFSLFLQKSGREGIYTANPDGTRISPVNTAGPEDFADWGTHPLAP